MAAAGDSINLRWRRMMSAVKFKIRDDNDISHPPRRTGYA